MVVCFGVTVWQRDIWRHLPSSDKWFCMQKVTNFRIYALEVSSICIDNYINSQCVIPRDFRPHQTTVYMVILIKSISWKLIWWFRHVHWDNIGNSMEVSQNNHVFACKYFIGCLSKSITKMGIVIWGLWYDYIDMLWFCFSKSRLNWLSIQHRIVQWIVYMLGFDEVILVKSNYQHGVATKNAILNGSYRP